MVAPQKFNGKDAEKSPSPEPFQEPEGMVTIDLNSDSSKNSEESKDYERSKQKTRARYILKMLFYLIFFITVSFSIFVFLDKHTNLFKKKYLEPKAENFSKSKTLYKQLMEKKYLTEKNQIIKCVVSETFEDCCHIFSGDVNFDNLCSVNRILDLIHNTFDIENDIIRMKRNPPDISQQIVSRERNTILDQYMDDFNNILTQQVPESIQDILRSANNYDDYDEYHMPDQRVVSQEYYGDYHMNEDMQSDVNRYMNEYMREAEDNRYVAEEINKHIARQNENFLEEKPQRQVETQKENFLQEEPNRNVAPQDEHFLAGEPNRHFEPQASENILPQMPNGHVVTQESDIFLPGGLHRPNEPQESENFSPRKPNGQVTIQGSENFVFNNPIPPQHIYEPFNEGVTSETPPLQQVVHDGNPGLFINHAYQENTDQTINPIIYNTKEEENTKHDDRGFHTNNNQAYQIHPEEPSHYFKQSSPVIYNQEKGEPTVLKSDAIYVQISPENPSKFLNINKNILNEDIKHFETPPLITNFKQNPEYDQSNKLHEATVPTQNPTNNEDLKVSTEFNPKQIEFTTTTPSVDHENKHARTNQQDEIIVKTKSNLPSFGTQLQANPQAMFNPCLYSYPFANPYGMQYKLASPFEETQVLKIIPSRTSQVVVNPPMYPYMQMPYMQLPQYLPNYVQAVQPSSNGQIQANGADGQYYVCNPLPASSSNLAALPGVEIRRAAPMLQEAIENFHKEEKESNLTRKSNMICPNGQFACEDGSRCIPKFKVCDNVIQCDDGSDEWFCSCKDRVGKLRICDGYFDCPNGEDEEGCFGCNSDEFNCDDWSRFRKSTCIPLEQRCDNIKQCVITGKDEEDCSVLASHVGNQPLFKISSTVGYLHRNYKGKWYPTCFGTEIWAVDVCKVEGGPSIINPRSHMMITQDNYNGNFINILPNNEISLVKTCVKDRAAFVECPPLYCGLRMTTKNPYRSQEVDTSAEEIINEIERVADIKQSSSKNSTSTNQTEENPTVGIIRVVGGKPSQPAAWPWLISIYKNGIFHCGGVLINEQWVVTAAHCLHRYWQYYYEIQAGMLRRFSFSPMEQRRWAVAVIQHENYDKSSLRNDIGLIKLSSPVRFNRYVRPICLPSEATAGRNFLDGPPVGTICTTVGWGATVEHGADPDHMREVEIPVLSRCKHPDDQEGDEICAGLSEGGKDACQGDSGGPFMCRNPNNPSQWYLAGIVSHGEGCARPNEPGVYTKVSRFVGWIAENMGDFKFESKMPLQRCPGFVCQGTEKCLPKKHHCDKIVDCLFGDDEIDCTFGFHDVFKHADDLLLNSVRNETQANIHDDNKEEIVAKTVLFNADDKSTFLPSAGIDDTKENVKNDNNTVIKTVKIEVNLNKSNVTLEPYFKCEKMLQLIPMNERCNKKYDCEDGTDELNCLCVDYVKNYNPSAICDGITDCFDLSDENMCVECNKTSEYHCRQSRTCIDLAKRCDGVADCTKGEDELDCAALTDGSTLTLDSDLRPELAMSGIITINRFGVWRPFCADDGSSAIGRPSQDHHRPAIATNVCNLLGFEEYVEYKGRPVVDRPLNVTIAGRSKGGIRNDDTSPNSNGTCDGLYVKCSNVSLDNFLHSVYLDNVTRDIELYTSPWNAVIYADGIFRCMGSILNSNWIVTSVNCFAGITTLKQHYLAVILGKGKSQLQIKGPHEEIMEIIQSIPIDNTDIIILRMKQHVSFNRYMKAANLNTRRDGRRKERCVAVGMHNNRTKFLYMSPIENCDVGYRCFESKLPEENCRNNAAWSGTIVCDSGSGWYPAAVYTESTGHCGLSSVKKYTSLKYFKNKIENIIKQAPIDTDAPHCEGFRCQLGECLDKKKVCNGIPECRGGEDEDPDLCYEKEMQCHLADKCECPPESLKCNNNKCVSKTLFCDRNNDCEDGEDEPDICSCRNFLKLTAPEKICDGVVHCMDRTDENPLECGCYSDSFKCGNSTTCISNQMVCDGMFDCPNGEDEQKCISVHGGENLGANAGEVFTRTGGIWHQGCFHRNHTVEELQDICSMLGFKGTNANQLSPARGVDNPIALRPELDPFGFVWIHRQQGNKLMLGIRTGNEPYVKFKEDPECYRLFLACL